jgi:hypothetical protein
MAAVEITEPADLTLTLRFDGGGDDAGFEAAAADLGFESGGHGVRGLSDGNYEDAIIGVEMVQIVANAQDTTLAVQVAGKSAFDGGVVKRGDENLAGRLPHLAEVLLTFGRQLGHERDYKAIESLTH